jgi:NAD-dependent SIR2 family protein deacetylase
MTSTDDDALARARGLLADASALLIGTGAGMGADSGLPTFRGSDGFWQAFPPARRLGICFRELAQPRWFDEQPRLAWAFYGWRLAAYRAARTHAGHAALALAIRRIGSRNAASLTSNVDGIALRAWPDILHAEVHGSIHHWQCTVPCCGDLWPAGEVAFDQERFELTGELPRCHRCGSVARPNILMFGDSTWISRRTDGQEQALSAWFADHSGALALEIGAGSAIATIRHLCARTGGGVVRINPDHDEPDEPPATVTIRSGAAAALTAIMR